MRIENGFLREDYEGELASSTSLSPIADSLGLLWADHGHGECYEREEVERVLRKLVEGKS